MKVKYKLDTNLKLSRQREQQRLKNIFKFVMYIKMHTVCVFVYNIEKLSGTPELAS